MHGLASRKERNNEAFLTGPDWFMIPASYPQILRSCRCIRGGEVTQARMCNSQSADLLEISTNSLMRSHE